MTSILEFRYVEELSRFSSTWQTLLNQTSGGSFFQSLEWLQLYWRHFGADQQLRVIMLERDHEVLGILPLVIRRESTRAGTIRVLTYPLHDWGSFFCPIGPNPAAILGAGLAYLRTQPRDWDLLDLRWIDKSELGQRNTPSAMAAAGYGNFEHVWRTTAFVDFAGSWQQYLASRSSKFRSNLRRAESQAAQAGEVTFQRYRPSGASSDNLDWTVFDECAELASSSWQGSSETGTTISHPEVRDFFRELFGIAGQAGSLDMNLLRLDGRLIAFSYNLVRAGMLVGLRMGFDPQHASISPGRLLLAKSFADSFERGDRAIDLGSESMDFKQHWLTRTVNVYRYTHYPLTSLRSQLLRTKHWLAAARSN